MTMERAPAPNPRADRAPINRMRSRRIDGTIEEGGTSGVIPTSTRAHDADPTGGFSVSGWTRRHPRRLSRSTTAVFELSSLFNLPLAIGV